MKTVRTQACGFDEYARHEGGLAQALLDSAPWPVLCQFEEHCWGKAMSVLIVRHSVRERDKVWRRAFDDLRTSDKGSKAHRLAVCIVQTLNAPRGGGQ